MARDLTEGKIFPQLIGFTIPVVLGNLFQLTYNAADSVIVGKYVGKEALAAVGICNPVMTVMILFLNGLCMGAGILMGTQYGAKDYDTLKRQISTSMLSGTVFSVGLTAVCVPLAGAILRLMQVDASILPLTAEYLRIIFCGLCFTFLYNFLSSTLRALGDSRTPLYFLIISSVLNVIGDLIFVIFFSMGSRGCAIATVLSEGLCCLFCALYIRLRVPLLRLGKAWFVFDRSLLGKTVSYGWVSAMQQATVQLGKIGVQSIVNTMGVPAAAAFTAVNRIDDFCYTPEQNIGHAMMAFMAQNRGAKKSERVRAGFRAGLILELCFGFLVSVVVFFLALPLIRLFSEDAEVISLGRDYLVCIAPMYIVPAISNGLQGYFRGMGDLKVTLISSIVNMGTRVIAAVVLVFGFRLGIRSLPFSYLIGWIAMLAVETPMLISNYKEHLKTM